MTRIPLPQVVESLQAHYEQPKSPKVAGQWEMILWENVAYLADDERRREAFQTLKKRVGGSRPDNPRRSSGLADEMESAFGRNTIVESGRQSKYKLSAKRST